VISSSGVISIVLSVLNVLNSNSDSKGMINFTKITNNILAYKGISDDGEGIISSGVTSIVLPESNVIQSNSDSKGMIDVTELYNRVCNNNDIIYVPEILPSYSDKSSFSKL